MSAFAKNVGNKWERCTEDEDPAQEFKAIVCVETAKPLTLRCMSEQCAANEKILGRFTCSLYHVERHIVKHHTPQQQKNKVRRYAELRRLFQLFCFPCWIAMFKLFMMITYTGVFFVLSIL